jgi:hypothetical protein
MKGAIAELSVNIISSPNSSNTMIIGASHHFLLVFEKIHNSFKIVILPISAIVLLSFVVQYFFCAWKKTQ